MSSEKKRIDGIAAIALSGIITTMSVMVYLRINKIYIHFKDHPDGTFFNGTTQSDFAAGVNKWKELCESAETSATAENELKRYTDIAKIIVNKYSDALISPILNSTTFGKIDNNFDTLITRIQEELNDKAARIGGSLSDFLREDGTYKEVTLCAIKRVVAYQIDKRMKELDMTKTELAKKLNTSRTQVDRILDPEYTTIKIGEMIAATEALGLEIHLSIINREKVAQ